MIGGLDPGTIWLQSPDQDPTESSLRSWISPQRKQFVAGLDKKFWMGRMK